MSPVQRVTSVRLPWLFALALFIFELSTHVPKASADQKGAIDLRHSIGVLKVRPVDGAPRICVGVLIGVDALITAAHCIIENGEPISPTQMSFRLWIDNKPNSEIASFSRSYRLKRLQSIGDTIREGKIKLLEVAFDWAILTLSTPVAGSKPLPISPRPVPVDRAPWDSMGIIIAYSQGEMRSHGPCPIASRNEQPIAAALNVLFLRCEVSGGASGGPIVVRTRGRIELVSIVSGFRSKTAVVEGATVGPILSGKLGALPRGPSLAAKSN